MADVMSVNLAELLRLERRPVQVLADSEYAEIGIYSFGRGIFHKMPRSGLMVGNKDLFLVREGDFIFQITFAWEGAVGLASHAEDGMYCSVRFPTFRVDENRCYAPYLLNYFRTLQGRDQLVRISPGSAGRNRVLNLKRLNEISITLPPLDEQRRIVARIESLAARIAEARGLRRDALAEAERWWLGAVAHILDAIPESRTLKEVASIICGQHLGPSEQADQGIPYITGPADFTEKVACPSRFASVIKATSELGDVLLTVKGAGVGKVNLAPSETTVIGRQLYAVRPNRDLLDQTFLWIVLQYRLTQLKEAITATTVPGIERSDVEPLDIPLPSLADQHLTVAYLNSLWDKIKVVRQLQAETQAELDALLPSILDKALRGEL